MTKDKLKDDVIRTICCLNSDISNKDRELLIKLFNSIIDYTNNTFKPKINSTDERVTALENSSQS